MFKGGLLYKKLSRGEGQRRGRGGGSVRPHEKWVKVVELSKFSLPYYYSFPPGEQGRRQGSISTDSTGFPSLVKDYPFPNNGFDPLSKTINHTCKDLFLGSLFNFITLFVFGILRIKPINSNLLISNGNANGTVTLVWQLLYKVTHTVTKMTL